jgi:predicted permease
MERLVNDLRFAARTLGRERGYTAVAVVTLALAIGGLVTLYSVVDALLLRGLPVAEADRVVRVHAVAVRTGALGPLSVPDALDYARSPALAVAAVHRVTAVSVTTGARPERAAAELVSGRYFTLLGARAGQGRLLGVGDDLAPLQHPVAVIADGFWRRFLGASADVVGRPLRINGHVFTIVGVAPPGFRGATNLVAPDLWVPVTMQAWVMPRGSDVLSNRDAAAFELLARLAPGISTTQANAALQAVARDLDRTFPRTAGDAPDPRSVRVVAASPVPTGLRGPVTAFTSLLSASALLVLVLTALNLANLQLARATARVPEMGLRHALGAERGALIGQLLTEQVLLALAGGLAGLGVTVGLQRALVATPAPTPVPVILPLRIDVRVLAAAFAISTVTGLLIGLLPAVRASRMAVASALRPPSEGGRLRLRRVLLVAQVAGSLALLTVSGLLATSLERSASADPGFESSRVALATMNVGLHGYTEARGVRFFEDLQARVAAAPGVEGASFGWTVPMGTAALSHPVAAATGWREAQPLHADYNFVAPGYFGVLGVRLVAGRAIEVRDAASSPRVAVVNEALASRLWPGQSGVRQRLRLVGGEGRRDGAVLGLSVPESLDVEVVGVVATVALRALGEAPRPAFYLPFTQWYQTERTLHVRSAHPAGTLSTIRAAVGTLDRDLPLFGVRMLSEHVAASLFAARAARRAFGAYGAFTLALAAVGLYGLASYSVQYRTREIAVRLAVGGCARDIVRLVVWESMRPVFWGLAIGVILAVVAANAARPFLFGASLASPMAWVSAVAALLLAAVAGALVPAWRASALAPAPILRRRE